MRKCAFLPLRHVFAVVLICSLFLLTSCGKQNDSPRIYLDNDFYWALTGANSAPEDAEKLKFEHLDNMGYKNLMDLVGIDGKYVWLKAEFELIWKDILADKELLGLMREEEFGATYNLKLVLNILAMMSYNRSVLSASNNKLNATLFPDSNGHPKYFTTEMDGSFSAFNSSSQQAVVQSIIGKHKK